MSLTAHDHNTTTASPAKKYRVGIVMPLGLFLGGSEAMFLNLLRANRKTDAIDFRVCFLEDGPMVASAKEMGYRTVLIPAGRLRQPHKYLWTVWKLWRWARKEKLDLFLAFMEKAHLYTSPAAILAGIPSTWWLHSIDPGSPMLNLITRMPAKLIFSDSIAAAKLQHDRKPLRPTTVSYCAVDVDRFDPKKLPSMAEARAEFGLPQDRPIIGIVARLQRWKGIHVFIAAAARVHAVRPDVQFVVVGGEHALEPGVKEELEAQVQRLQLANCVRFAGHQTNVPLWMQSFDVFVHCSSKTEPFGTVIAEAMALGKRVIAAKAGGPLEYVIEGVTGRLAVPGDDADLARAMLESLEDTPANREMSERAHNTAAGFSAERLANDVALRLPMVFDPNLTPTREILKP